MKRYVEKIYVDMWENQYPATIFSNESNAKKVLSSKANCTTTDPCSQECWKWRLTFYLDLSREDYANVTSDDVTSRVRRVVAVEVYDDVRLAAGSAAVDERQLGVRVSIHAGYSLSFIITVRWDYNDSNDNNVIFYLISWSFREFIVPELNFYTYFYMFLRNAATRTNNINKK